MRCLADFERELAQALTLEEKFKVVFEGLILNVFTFGLRKIDQLNLATLEIRNPEIYETVKDKGVREVLVNIEMYNINIFKNPDKSEVELGRQMVDDYGALFDALETVGAYRFQEHFKTACGWIVSVEDLGGFYGGPDAVKVFLKALYLLCKYVTLGEFRLGYEVNEENYSKLAAWLKLDEIECVSHKGRIERIRWLAPIYSKLEKCKRTIKKKIGLTLSS